MSAPKEVKGVECENCGEFQPVDPKVLETRFQCPDCEAYHASEADAKDCCGD